VVYQSQQSYYELMHAAGLSYHKSEKVNPKRDETLVQERREALKKTGAALAGNKARRDGGVARRRVSSALGRCVWLCLGVRGEPIEVPLTNQKQRQTYYGALNFLTREFHLKAFPAGNSQHTQSYLQWLQELYPGKQLLLLWDGASYHRDGALQEFLAHVNQGLDEGFRRSPLAPHAVPLCAQRTRAKSGGRRLVGGEESSATVLFPQHNLCPSQKLLLCLFAELQFAVGQVRLVCTRFTTHLGAL
jgi:DDE superfamily endonuclease